ADGRQMEAVTKDLSINGTYLRVPLSETVEMDELVHVKMQGQNKDYNDIVGQGIEYQVKRIEFIDRVIWLGLNRTFSEKKTDFADYVKELIICNKFVYKVNLDNAIDAALKQGHEQVFFARTATIPLFVETLGNQYRLRYALTCGLNEHELRFFSAPEGHQYLTCVFSPTVLRGLLNSDNDETLLYCFTHKLPGQVLYFAAFEQQLRDDPALGKLFLGYSSQKDSFKVFKIKRVSIDKSNANLLFTVPNRNLAAEEEQDETEVVPNNQRKPVDIGNITHAFLLTQICDKYCRKHLGELSFDKALMPRITEFQINYNDSGLPLQWVKYGLEELRHEPRFAYKTKVVVKFDNGMQLDSTSADFSAKGVQIVLPKEVEVQQRDRIRLALPLLQKITKQLTLTDLEYRVVRTENSQKTLYLQAVEVEELQHHGVKFFSDLIKRNRRKLTLVADSSEQQQLTKILKNLYQKVLATMPFYLNRVDGELRVTKFVNSQNPHPLLDLIKTDEFVSKVNIAILFANPSFATYIKSGTQKQRAGQYHRSIDLYIRHTGELAHPDNFVVKTDVEFANTEAQKDFVREAVSQGQFNCIRVFMSEVVRVEVRKIADELEYIHHYAQHKSKRIAQLLTRINNVGEFVDITQFVLSYLNINIDETLELAVV
ncbi:MAG: PilZ domain-containing protein, partial [Algicola sp.]|nr:PilZ domain-containing protein [Algicola sp.]